MDLVNLIHYTSSIEYMGNFLTEKVCAYRDYLVNESSKIFDNPSSVDLSIRVVKFALAIILFPISIPCYCLGICLKGIANIISNDEISSSEHKKIEELKKIISDLRLKELPGWEKEAMELLRKIRLDDPFAEVKRLRAFGILNSEIESKLEKSIKQVSNSLSSTNIAQIKALVGQAIEIKQIYKKKYHVFIHAQGSNWLGLNYLVKELEKSFNPSKNLKHFKFLRAPCKLASLEMKSAMWKNFRSFFLGEERINNVRDYVNSKWVVSDSDNETREHLLSADAYFFNSQKWESSLYFLINNSNILGKSSTIQHFYKQIISYYNNQISSKKASHLAQQIFEATASTSSTCGNLFAICVPKDQSLNIQYRAHPFGKTCKCHSAKLYDKILTMLQNNQFDKNIACSVSRCPIPQFRIYTPMLQPETTPIYLMTPFKKNHRNLLKNKIKNIVSVINCN